MNAGNVFRMLVLLLSTGLLLTSGCQKTLFSSSFANPSRTYPVGFNGMNGEVDSFLFHSLAFYRSGRSPIVFTSSWSRILSTTSPSSSAVEKVKLTTIPFVILLTDPEQLNSKSQGVVRPRLGVPSSDWETAFDGQFISFQQSTSSSLLGTIEWSASIEGEEPHLESLKIGNHEIDLSLGTLILVDSGTGSATGIKIRQRQWKSNFDRRELTDLLDFNGQHQSLAPKILKELGY
ncbi:MAG: hypothetical protein AAEJ04_01980 [Planctomycetota bacterium]